MSDLRAIPNHACLVANLAHTLVVQDGDTYYVMAGGSRRPGALSL